MNYKKLFSGAILCTFTLVFAACKLDSSSKLKSEENNVLKGERIELAETFSAIDLEIIDTLLILLCYGDQYKFHVYSKNTFEFIGKFGREGRGPSEYILPIILSQERRINDSAYLITYDNTLKRISFVNILKAIDNINYFPKSINSRDKNNFQLSTITSAVLSDDSLFIGASGDNNIRGRFFCYDIFNENLKWVPYYPITKQMLKKMFQACLYTSYLALNPTTSDIAVASLFFKRLDILDNKGNPKGSIIFNQDREPDFSNADSWPIKGSHEYFTSISVSKDFIYALDIDLDVDSREIIDTAFIIKVPWNEMKSQPETFKLTPRILKMQVDEETNRIIGLNLFSSFIYVYNMPISSKL